jgi:hypothetical protein
LRGLRIAARLGFQFSEETAAALNKLSSSISTLTKVSLVQSVQLVSFYLVTAFSTFHYLLSLFYYVAKVTDGAEFHVGIWCSKTINPVAKKIWAS